LNRWALIMRSAAEPVIRQLVTGLNQENPSTFSSSFHDESGNQRPVDPFLIGAVFGHAAVRTTFSGDSPDVQLWASITDGRTAVEQFLSGDSKGPLIRHPAGTSIEVLTETEACALHALWTIARVRVQTDLTARCLSAAQWHIAELQPDNATNSPWAIHVFAMLSILGVDSRGFMEAESRLHNCHVGRAQLDQRSAMILKHASMELELLVQTV